MDSSQGQLLPHDSSGFLVGERLVKGVDLVGKDTAEILKILRASFGLQIISNNRLRVTLDRINNKLSSRTIDVTPMPSPVPRLGNGNNGNNGNPPPTVDTGAPNPQPIPPTREIGDPAPDNGGNPAPVPPAPANPPSPDPSADSDPPQPPAPADDGRRNNGRRRNARGQFEGDSSGGLINGIKNAVRDGFSMGSADTQNIDPTVDAVRELGDLMSPLAKVGKTMFKGAAWLFRRKKKREEPSDQEQRQQSRIEKLLKRIAGSRVGQAAGSGFNLFGGLFSSLAGTAGGLLSGLGKILTGAILPALGLTAAFKLGEWIGGKIYEAIGPALGDTIDAVMAIPEKIGKAWDSVVGAASQGIETIVDYVKGIKNKVIGAATDGMEWVADKLKPVTTSKSANENQLMVYKAFKSTGMSDAQAKAMTAEVGRENDYTDKNLYGSHTDDKNKVTNQGMFSWQKDRRTSLVSFMKKRGLVDEAGNFKKGQESLNAQAEFAKAEIDSGKYEKTRQFFAANPNASPEAAAQVLGHDYVGWRIDDPRYSANGNMRRRGHLANLDKQLAKANNPTALPTMMTANTTINPPVDFFSGGIVSGNNTKTIAPAIPMSVPKLLARPMPEVPKQKQQVSTKEQKPMQVSVVGGNEVIGQNLSDRHLAHAVTGGLGMDALRHG